MPRTEVYQLRLTKAEKDELAARAREQRISMAKLIRQRLRLDAENPPYTDQEIKNALLGAAIKADNERTVARSSMAEHSPVKREVGGSSPPAPVERETKLKTLANHFFARGMTSRQAKLEAERKIDG